MKYKLHEVITAKHDYMMNYGLREFTAGNYYFPYKYENDLYYVTNDSACEHMLNENDMDEIFTDTNTNTNTPDAFDDAMSIVN